METDHRGLSVRISLDGDYSKAGSKLRDYIYQTSLITPYVTITFDPKGNQYRYERIINSMPPSPTITPPRRGCGDNSPHGIRVHYHHSMTIQKPGKNRTQVREPFLHNTKHDTTRCIHYTDPRPQSVKINEPHHSHLISVGEPLLSFLTKRFQRVTRRPAHSCISPD